MFFFQFVGVALGEGGPVAEQAPLVADDSVQRMADIVQNSQHFVVCRSPLCLSPESPPDQLVLDEVMMIFSCALVAVSETDL